MLIKDAAVKIAKLKAKRGSTACGIVILNKPRPMSSRVAMFAVQAKLKAEKAGYAGTIDANYTGVLPVLFGKAAKLSNVLSTSTKIYVGMMKFHKPISKAQVLKLFKEFTGTIKQLPPRKSSVKRVIRDREIHYIKLKSFKNQIAEFEVKCQHGTYIRKLASDIGEKVGGAHLFGLNRIQSGPFKIKDAVTLDELSDKNIVRAEEGAAHLPTVFIDDGVIEPVRSGSPVYAPGVLRFSEDIKPGCVVALKNRNSELVALGVAALGSEDIKTAEKGIAIKTDFVLI